MLIFFSVWALPNDGTAWGRGKRVAIISNFVRKREGVESEKKVDNILQKRSLGIVIFASRNI